MNTIGYLKSPLIKGVVFCLLSCCLALLAITGLLQTWNAILPTTAYRLYSTAGILSLASLGFLLLNYVFGNFEKDLFPPSNSERIPNDPDFANRLEKAKSMRSAEKPAAKAG